MAKTTAIVVGTGSMARAHLRAMLGMARSTALVGLVEPADASREAARTVFEERGAACPPFYATIAELLRAQGPADTAFVCSPHVFHFEHARESLRAGMDVLLEKPMVMNADEARRLIRVRDRTGRLLVVAFPGSLSPAVRKARAMITAGAIGRVTAIAGHVHQRWKAGTVGTWRQQPEISGGGFLFDTGSHLVNTVVDLLGEDVVRVTALLERAGAPVEISASVGAVSAGGTVISLAAAGDSIQCRSGILVFGDRGVLRTGIWGEELALKKARDDDFARVPCRRTRGPWDEFLRVRAGRQTNPCPPEVGLRFARLMDMIRAADETGRVVTARRGARTKR